MAAVVEPNAQYLADLLNGVLGDLKQVNEGFSTCPRTNKREKLGDELKNAVDNDKKFAVSIDVSHFTLDELEVNLDGRVLSITASQENNGNSFFRKSFTRKWTLPEDVDLTAIESYINVEGTLRVEAPKKGKTAVRKIPILPDFERSS